MIWAISTIYHKSINKKNRNCLTPVSWISQQYSNRSDEPDDLKDTEDVEYGKNNIRECLSHTPPIQWISEYSALLVENKVYYKIVAKLNSNFNFNYNLSWDSFISNFSNHPTPPQPPHPTPTTHPPTHPPEKVRNDRKSKHSPNPNLNLNSNLNPKPNLNPNPNLNLNLN